MVTTLKKALFWDYDGTLVYPDSKWSDSLYSALTKLGYSIEIEKIKNHLSSRINEEVKVQFTWHTPEVSYADTIGHKWWGRLFKSLERFYEYHMVSKEDSEKVNSYLKNYILDFNNHTLYDDAITTLCKCTEMGYKNYILSNNFPELALVIKDLKLADYFDDYVISANIGYEKPRIEIFQYALNIANSPDVCYMIGDNPVADIQGAKAVGMKTILVHNDNSFEADFKSENLSKIPLLLG